jgi:peptidyl-dipeptidase Dcp
MNTQSALELSNLRNNAIRFDQIQIEDFKPKLLSEIKKAKERLETIKNNSEAPDFKNTIEALELMADGVDLVSNIFHNLLSANTNERMQELAKEFGPILSEYSNDIMLDDKLFKRIEAVWNKKDALKLTTEEFSLLEKTYKEFVRNGARLNNEQKAKLRAIDAELSKLSPQFDENELKSLNAFQLWVTDEHELKGLPPAALSAAKQAAKEKGKDNAYLFTLHAPSYLPLLMYCDHRPHRETIFRAVGSIAFGGETDNQPVIKRTLTLREERAKLLGYKTHAHFVLERRMAETPERVMSFIERINKASLNRAKEELKELTDFAQSIGGPKEIMPWDFSYYSEKLKEAKYKFNSEELRPYFKLENVIEGVFAHGAKLYDLKFVEKKDYPVYHPEVKTYEVYDALNNKFIGLFYADFFPRPSKNAGAWATTYLEQGYFMGELRRPHVANVCNFTKSTPDTPSLLSFDEVLTLFHEFGHALHMLLSQCRYRSISGANVYWDFVELPSQVMENWVYEKESLDLFARHHQTGEKMPAHLAAKIKESSKFMAGYMSLRQMTFATLDMMYHLTPAKEITNIAQFEREVLEPLRLLPAVDGICRSCSFGHIFAGGYSSGYYSYKWAEVLDADAFSYFLETGLFNKETAKKFRTEILERGGTEHPMTLFKRFRGREPDPDALLKRDGLI